MERLLADATKFSGVDYNIENLDDVYQAIHVIQGEMDITGTTAREASETISGSFSSMKSAFTNVLGDLALGNDIKPALNALGGTIKTFFVGNLLPMIKTIFAQIPDVIKTIAPQIIPAIKAIGSEIFGVFGEDAVTRFKETVDKIAEFIPKAFEKAITVFQAVKDNANIIIPVLEALLGAFIAFKVIKGILEGIAIAQGLLNLVMSANPIGVLILAISALVGVGILLWRNWDVIKEKAMELWSKMTEVWSAIKITVSDTLNNMIQSVVNAWNNIKNSFNLSMSAIKLGVMLWVLGVKMTIHNTMTAIRDTIIAIWNGIKMFFSTILNGIKFIISSVWEGIKIIIWSVLTAISTTISNIWNGIVSFLRITMTTITSTMVNAWNSVKTKTSELWEGIKNVVVNSANTLVNKVKEIPSLMANAILRGRDVFKNAFASIWESAVKAVAIPANKVISGANWVLEKLGSKSTIQKWTPYAKGTDGHKGGHALVNDATGSNYEELVELPDGRQFIPQGRNVLLPNLPKGTQVLTAEKTAQLSKYAKGVGSGLKNTANKIVQGVKSIGSNAKDKVKDKIDDVMSYFSNPSGLASKVIDKFVDYGGASGMALDMGKGLVGKAKTQLVDFIKSKFSALAPNTGGAGDFSGAGSAPMFSGGRGFAGLVKTSPYGMRGHPIFGNRRMHTGVDFGGGQRFGHPIYAQAPGVVDFAGRMGGYGNVLRTRIGNLQHMYAHLQSIVGRMGQNIQTGQLVGKMGSTGNSTGPHVHYEVRRNGSHIHPGFEDGGLVDKHQTAEIGEGNKPEMIVPLTKKSRAKQLINKSSRMIGMDDDTNILKEMLLEFRAMKQNLLELKNNISGEVNIIIEKAIIREEADIKKLAREIKREQDNQNRAGGRLVYGN